jgi:uncharacterized protein DUF6748
MLKQIWAALPLALVACSSSSPHDELAGETAADDAADDGKADAAVDGAYTYFEIKADLRKCASPVCGGFFVDRVNRSSTKCVDGTYADACYAPELDLSEADVPDTTMDKLVSAANASALATGPSVIVRGRFARTNSTPRPELGRFVVTEVWLAQTDTPASGVFVRARDAGVRCIAAPCASTLEKGLNESRSAMIADIDFTDAQLSDRLLETVTNDLFTDHGIIFAGDRYTVSENGRHEKGRTATAVYLKVTQPLAGE